MSKSMYNLKSRENGREGVFFGESLESAKAVASDHWGVSKDSIEEI